MKDRLVRISFATTEELQKKVKEHAESRGLSMSSYLRSLIINDLEKFQERAKKA